MFYNREYDEFRSQFDDEVVIGKPEEQNHFCISYSDHIPDDIYHNGAECPFYQAKA